MTYYEGNQMLLSAEYLWMCSMYCM